MSGEAPSTIGVPGALAAVGYADKSTARQSRLVAWRPLRSGSLRGFATVRLRIGLTIRDVPVLVGRNGAWATPPGKPQLDKDGCQRKDINGKAACVAILEWDDRALNECFSNAVVSAVRRRYPGDLEES